MKTNDLMPIERIPDWEKRIQRHDAFWENEIIDRPFVSIIFSRENPEFPKPTGKAFTNQRERWFDSDFTAENTLHSIMNTEYLGDSLPIFNPNLGPEVLTAFMGMEMEFGEGTSWGIPNLENWDDTGKIQFSEDNVYFQKMMEITDALLQVGHGRFYVGQTDYHPGGDAVAALRDPMNLNYDMVECPDKVKALTEQIEKEYFKIFDLFHQRLTIENKQAVTAWPGIVSSKKWYVPSNDFSCMISKEMFDEVFLPGIISECEFYQNSIYHLDGPDALRHLDSLLDIPKLNAIQWVYGAGNGRASDWLDVYKKCQAAGKGIQLYIQPDELDTIMENLQPEGVWLGIRNAQNTEHAENLIKKISDWPCGTTYAST